MTKEEVLSYLQEYTQAVASYTQGRKQFSGNDLERDGLIQRFEYCIELTWKVARKLLIFAGLDIASTPAEVLRAAHHNKLLEHSDILMDLVRSRNRFAHIYDEEDIGKEFLFIKQHKNIFNPLPVVFLEYFKQLCVDPT